MRIDLNEPRIYEKVLNDRFGRLVSKSWKDLLDPYTPRDTGQLENNVQIMPFKLWYKQRYANRQYNGEDFNFQKKNPYSTYEWDKAAEQAGQKDKLYRTLNNALRNGNY